MPDELHELHVEPNRRTETLEETEVALLDVQLCFDIYTTSRTLTKAYRGLLDRLELTYPQYLVMLALWERDRQSVKALGDRLDLDSGTLSPLLKRLEASGLVRRERARRDEREVEISLTGMGLALRGRAQSVPTDIACLMGLSREERRDVQRTLRRLRQNLERATATSEEP